MRSSLLMLLLAALSVSCASKDHDSTDNPALSAGTRAAGQGATGAQSAGKGGSAPAAECHWPSNLAAVGSGSREVCAASRAYLQCKAGNTTVECASDDFSTCADTSAVEGYHLNDCTSHCKDNEYVVFCGGIGPGPVPDPPEGCGPLAFANPGGIVNYCCPCE